MGFKRLKAILGCLLTGAALWVSFTARAEPWRRHAIGEGGRGADGVRLGDVDGDGRLDVATGFEEEAVTRLFACPPAGKVWQPWPSVVVGRTPHVEDAFFADVDADGRPDVVTCCEGPTRQVFVHWAPPKSRMLDSQAWERDAFSVPRDGTMWMFGVPIVLAQGRNVLVVAGKNGGPNGAALGFLVPPNSTGRNLDAWRFIEQTRVGWVMSLIVYDVDDDGDDDIVYSDRKPYEGSPEHTSGVYWLEHPGGGEKAFLERWPRHRIGANGREVMFIDVRDSDADGRPDVLAAVKPREVLWYVSGKNVRDAWTCRETIDLTNREFRIGDAKAVRAADLDGDGIREIVFTCEHAVPPASGVVYLDRRDSRWTMHDISGPDGIKFDRIETVDLDGDGDLDVLTTEERHIWNTDREDMGLGVVWYENPADAN
ncbi:hypothetical protein JCM19992_18900 [Thermostilla marina]